MDVDKILANFIARRKDIFSADVPAKDNPPTQAPLPTKEEKAADKVSAAVGTSTQPNLRGIETENKASATAIANVTVKAQPRKIILPPNCYDENGMIESYAGQFSYGQIFKFTHCPLEIHNDGRRIVSCRKCSLPRELKTGKITKKMKALACADCRGNLNYIQACNNATEKIRHYLHLKGLVNFADFMMLGYDAEKKILIFPLNHHQYVTLGFDGREFTQPKAECLKVLMHFNRPLHKDSEGRFVPKWTGKCYCDELPYLDNRFFGTRGEVVIAGNPAFRDDGKRQVEEGKLLLPFPLDNGDDPRK